METPQPTQRCDNCGDVHEGTCTKPASRHWVAGTVINHQHTKEAIQQAFDQQNKTMGNELVKYLRSKLQPTNDPRGCRTTKTPFHGEMQLIESREPNGDVRLDLVVYVEPKE